MSSTVTIYPDLHADDYYYYRNGTKTRVTEDIGFAGRTDGGNQYYWFANISIAALSAVPRAMIKSAKFYAMRDDSESNNTTQQIHIGIAAYGPSYAQVSGCAAAFSRSMTDGPDHYEMWDITTAFKALNQGTDAISLVLWSTSGGSYTCFMTVEDSSAGKKPYLEVEFEEGTVGYQNNDGYHRCEVHYMHSDGIHRVIPYYLSAEGLKEIST
jgi:hypothetical protein